MPDRLDGSHARLSHRWSSKSRMSGMPDAAFGQPSRAQHAKVIKRAWYFYQQGTAIAVSAVIFIL